MLLCNKKEDTDLTMTPSPNLQSIKHKINMKNKRIFVSVAAAENPQQVLRLQSYCFF